MKIISTIALLFMTATVRADLVGSSTEATNHKPVSAGMPSTHVPADRFAALSMIESGDCDTCIGPNGEVSRYQIAPAIWKSNSNFMVFPLHHPEQARNISPTNEQDAFAVAYDIQYHRVRKFEDTYHRPPTDAEWYLLWHRPACLFTARKPTTREADRARRFANLCSRP